MSRITNRSIFNACEPPSWHGKRKVEGPLSPGKFGGDLFIKSLAMRRSDERGYSQSPMAVPRGFAPVRENTRRRLRIVACVIAAISVLSIAVWLHFGWI